VFSFLYSEEKKMRQNAANWLELADRVYKFRRDQLTDTQNQQLLTAAGAVRLRLKERADAPKLKLAIEALERVLRDTGGKIYPASSMVENVEFFLVAAIVILGLRAYFVQPFKIPTNSMWPTYYGVTHETEAPGESRNLAERAWRFAALLAWHYEADAPVDGELKLPVFLFRGQEVINAVPVFTQVPGRTLGIFPTVRRQFPVMVGGETVSVTIPGAGTSTDDFRMEKVLNDVIGGKGPGLAAWEELVTSAANTKGKLESTIMTIQFNGQTQERRVFWIPTGRMFKKGEPVISFDLLTGDLLFVDRISYNFIRPQVGSGFVFQTKNIPDIGSDQYYIKRLVGTPGDTLEVRSPVLWRNGAPIAGAAAFDDNARQRPPYRGYSYPTPEAAKYLGKGETLTVPAHKFFAMGDNSYESADSRYWGFVPEKDVVGRPLFIYYPITRRWGPAK